MWALSAILILAIYCGIFTTNGVEAAKNKGNINHKAPLIVLDFFLTNKMCNLMLPFIFLVVAVR